MADSRDPDGEQSPYLRVPWPLAALGLVIVLGLVLGLGIWFTQSSRRPQTAPPTTAASTPLPASTLVATAPPAPPTAVVAPTSVTGPETPEAGGLQTPTQAPTVQPEIVAEVIRAYQHYWDVRAMALWTLDTTQLPDVMDGDHLRSADELIAQLRQENRAIRTEVDHHYSLIFASEDEAVVQDQYLDSSWYVDLDSREIIGSPSNDHLDEQYRLAKLDEKWKVVSLARVA